MTSIIDQQTAIAAPAYEQTPVMRPVQNHQALSVVCALVCFAPLGIAAVVWAGNVRTRLALGDQEGARAASRTALRLCWASAMMQMFFLLVIVVCLATSPNVH
jgi:hypothetical protein